MHGQLGDIQNLSDGYTHLNKFDQASNSGLAVGQAVVYVVGLRLNNKLLFHVTVILIHLHAADA